MLAKVRVSRRWLLWAGLALVVPVMVVLLVGGPEVSQAQTLTDVEAPVDAQVRAAPVFHYLPMVSRNYQFPRFAVSKTATPETVRAGTGATIVYTLTIVNQASHDAATVQTVYDTLPDGFTFAGMQVGSDVMDDPDRTTGKITWTKPFTVGAGEEVHIVYGVSPSDVPGTYVNAASLTSLDALEPSVPASASVTVMPALLLEEHFNDTIDRWTPFLNYPSRLAPGQWYWGPHDGIDNSGAATQNCYAVDGKEAEDALLMYLAPGSENWTDYRVETKLILRTLNYPHGLWVRGQYQDVGAEDPAGWVTGYYIMVGGGASAGTHYVSLKQLQTLTDCWDAACNNPQNLYDFNNPHELTYTKKEGTLARYRWYTLTVEVRGNRIMVWLDGDLYIDYVDEKEPFLTGTVGLKTFKADTVSFDDVIVTPLD